MSINIKDFNEREFHPFLNYFLYKKMGIAGKTIFQERSKNSAKGENEWIHPDMVGLSLPTSSMDTKISDLSITHNIPKIILYSFEIKKEITISNLREVFFQAVSNSSWANEGYLVTVDIDEEDSKLIEKFRRLSNSFGIGLIRLNLLSPSESKVLLPAKRRESVDTDTINHLYSINPDFQEYILTIEQSLKINTIVREKLDHLKSINNLKEMLDNSPSEFNSSLPLFDVDTNNHSNSIFNWDDTAIYTKPTLLKIYEQEFICSTWKDVYINFCEYIGGLDPKKMLIVIQQTKGKKTPLFSASKEMVRSPFYIDSANLFVEVNLSSDRIVNTIKKIANIYNIDLRDINIILTQNEKKHN